MQHVRLYTMAKYAACNNVYAILYSTPTMQYAIICHMPNYVVCQTMHHAKISSMPDYAACPEMNYAAYWRMSDNICSPGIVRLS